MSGRALTLLAVAGGWLVVLGSRFVVPTLLPQVKATFGVDNATAGLAVTALWLTYALAQFPAGILVDRVGERVLLAGSLVGSAVAVVLLGTAPVFVVFVLGCVALGGTSGFFGPPRGTVLSKRFPESDGTAFGLTLSAGSVGAALLPVAATAVAVRAGWSVAVLVMAPVFLAFGLAAWRWVVVPSTADVSSRTDGGAVALWPAVRGALASLGDRKVALAVVGLTLMLFAFQGVTAFLPTYLVEQRGVDESTAATLYAGLFLSGAAFQLGLGNAADRFGAKRVLLVIAAVGVVPLVAFPFVGGLAAFAVLSVAIGMRLAVGPVNNAYVVAVLPAEVQGTAWGLIRTLVFVVGSTGSAVVGALADAGYFDAAFVALGGVTGVAAVVYLFLPTRR